MLKGWGTTKAMTGSGRSVRYGDMVSPYLLGIVVALGLSLFMTACGDDGGGRYGRANSYEGCMSQCDEANECGVASNCSVTCALYHLEASGFLTGPQRECMRGMGEYYACVGQHCSADEDGVPHYTEEGIEACEPLADKYTAICEAADH